jgi:hypothetical protein
VDHQILQKWSLSGRKGLEIAVVNRTHQLEEIRLSGFLELNKKGY